MRRSGPAGDVIMPGHVGRAYQCFGAAYRGRTKPRSEMATPDGQIFSERAISKIRNHETGMAYAIDELVRRGAPKPTADTKSWLESLSSVGFFTRRKHSGNHIRSEENTSELQSLMRISYAVFRLQKKIKKKENKHEEN